MPDASTVTRQCPWCAGRLALHARFPLRQLIPGELRVVADANVPEAFKLVPAWVCTTPHCRFRESA